MAKLPTIQPRGAVTRGPQSSISPSEVASPFQQIAGAFAAVGEFVDGKAKDDARIDGEAAVQRDAEGNLKVDLRPNWSENNRIYNKVAMLDFTAKAELDARSSATRFQQEARGNPETFKTTWKGYRDQQLTLAPRETRAGLKTILDREGQLGLTGVQDQKFRADMAMSKSTLLSSIEMKQDEMAALAFQGGTATPEYRERQEDIRVLWSELSGNPVFQISPEEADMKMKQMEGRHTGEAILGQAERALQAGDFNKVASMRQSILSDSEIPLSPQERRQYAGMITERQSNFNAQRKVVTDALKERGKDRLKMWEQGTGLDDNADDELIAELKKQDLASGRDLERKRGLHRDLANYRKLGNADQVAVLERDIANENRPAPTRSRPVSVSPQLSGRMEQAMKHYIARGLSPVMAAGIVGNLVQESSLNTSALNPGDGRDGSNSIGIGQWNGARAQALKKFAADRGASPEDFSTQLDFVVHELETTEGVSYQRLKAARNVDEATAAMIGFERPAGWSDTNPRGGHGWENRLAMAMKAGEMQGLAGEVLAVTQSASVPPELVKEYQQEVTSDLKSDLARWKTEIGNGNIPDAGSLNLLQRQLALVDDQNLRTEYQSIFSQSEAFTTAYRENPSVAAEFLNSLEATAGGDGVTLAQAEIIDAFRKGDTARTSALTSDPHSYGSRVGLYQPLKSLNFEDPAGWDETLGSYQTAVSTLKARGLVGEISALPPTVEQDLLQRVSRATPGETLGFLSSMQRSLAPSTYQATLSKLYGSGAGRTVAAAGAVASYNPEAAEGILRGQMLLKENPNLAPKKTDDNALAVDEKLPTQAFAAGQEGSRQFLLESATARYADLSHQAGDTSGEFNDTRMQQAITEVTGGVVEMNGYSVIVPRYGMTQDDFDKRLSELTDADLADVVATNGVAVQARDVRDQARLRAVADGRYLVEFGRPEAPMYATKKDGSAFVLDLRDRE